jgi:NADPH:quinone reductase-like Zn-dependent oxidoreductase
VDEWEVPESAVMKAVRYTEYGSPVYPLSDVRQAILHVEEGRARGKVVITIIQRT